MLTIAYYFLQVLLCSGMLMGYYWLVLRNKRFHQYNRFYLLAATLLSWIVPLIKISWHRPVFDNEAPPMMNLLSVVADNNSQIEATITRKGFIWNWDLLASGIYFAVATVLLAAMIHAFVRLYRLMKHHSCKNVGEVFLILTHAKGTPFSFFRYIFWNEEIDIRSEAGQQILQHELTHVQQKHSFDKLFIQFVLIAGWFNPFFWLLRREMEMIHEFIADKKAVNNGDTAALAQMLLTAAYPQQKFALTHPFFFSPIKRRLLMLTNNRNPRFSYIRRLVVLPLLAVVIVLFAFRSKEQRENGELSVATVVANYKEDIKDVFLTDVKQQPGDNSFLINGKKFSAQTINIGDLKYGPYLLGLKDEKSIVEFKHTELAPLGGYAVPDPLLIVNGQRITIEQFKNLDPNSLESVNVFKGSDATAHYGNDGANGVVDITLRSPNSKEITITPLKDDGRFSFLPLTTVVKDSYNAIPKNRKIYLKEIIYQGEEKIKVFEEVHETTSDNEGLVSVKIGTGTVDASSKPLSEIDLSKGPFYVNVKAAIAPSVSAPTWRASDVYVDLGFSKLAVKDNMPDKFIPSPIGISGRLVPQTGSNTFLTAGPNGDVTWTSPSPGGGDIKVTASNISFNLADGRTAMTTNVSTSIKPAADNSSKKTEELSANQSPENNLNEVTVIGYGTRKPEEKQGGTPAHFPGGQIAWEKYLLRNLNRDVPKNNNGTFGKYTVVVSFVVDKEGNISEIKALNDPGFGTKAEAERIISKGPKWVPAKDEKGQPVLYRQKQNISFIYADEKSGGSIVTTDPAEASKNTFSTGSRPMTTTEKIAGGGFSATASTQPLTTSAKTAGGEYSGTLAAYSMTLPSFPGGPSAWTQYLKRNVDNEAIAKKGGPPGNYTAVVSFLVNTDGSVTEVRGENNPGYGSKELAEKLFTKGPRWVPASKDGKPVAYRHKMSITFVVKDKMASSDPARLPGVTTLPNNIASINSIKGNDVTVNANSTAVAVVDVPNVKKGDPILVTPQKDDAGWSVYSAWVSAANEVTVRFANHSQKEVKVDGDDYKIIVVKERP
jgi:beta-lactamase regulating signal transducer with metallopeptidase domain